MAKPILYKMDSSPPACAVRILADLIELDLDYIDIDFGSLEHKSAEFMELNPMGTVPTIVDDGFVLSDSNAIMMYLLKKYGGDYNEKFYPSDLKTRAIVDQCLFFNAGVFFIRLKVIALPAFFHGATEASPKQYEDIDTAYGVVENYLGDRKFVAADQLTIADLAVGTTAASFQGLHPINAKKYPRTAKWFAELNEIPAFKKYASVSTQSIADGVRAMWKKNKGE